MSAVTAAMLGQQLAGLGLCVAGRLLQPGHLGGQGRPAGLEVF